MTDRGSNNSDLGPWWSGASGEHEHTIWKRRSETSGTPTITPTEQTTQTVHHGASGANHTDKGWDVPDLSVLGTGRRPAPNFPIELFGESCADWCQRSAESASAPVDYVAAPLLGCIGASLANVRHPTTEAGWSEPPVLWIGVVGSPSSGKSPGVGSVLAPVRYAEDQLASGYDDDLRAYELAKTSAEAKRQIWDKEVQQAVKADGLAPPLPLDAVPPVMPVRPRIHVADITTEKAAILAAGLPRGFLIFRDELAGWFGSLGRYNGSGSDRAFALEMYGGRAYIVDRVKNPEPLRIANLSIGVLGSIQPDRLSAIVDGPDDGLSSRFAWCWPEPPQDIRLARSSVDDSAARKAFIRLTGLPMGIDELGRLAPKQVLLEPAALDRLEQFAREVHRQAADANGPLAGTLGKARGHVLRLSCVLEFLWWSFGQSDHEPEYISLTAVAAATSLVQEYFIPMAERTFGDAAIPTTERAAMTLARDLKKNKLSGFNARDVRRRIGGTLREASAMDAACAFLEEAGLVRPKLPNSSGPGRKAKLYEVNPILYKGGQN